MGRVARSIGRAVSGVVRGVGRVVSGVAKGVGKVVGGVLSGIGSIAKGVLGSPLLMGLGGGLLGFTIGGPLGALMGGGLGMMMGSSFNDMFNPQSMTDPQMSMGMMGSMGMPMTGMMGGMSGYGMPCGMGMGMMGGYSPYGDTNMMMQQQMMMMQMMMMMMQQQMMMGMGGFNPCMNPCTSAMRNCMGTPMGMSGFGYPTQQAGSINGAIQPFNGRTCKPLDNYRVTSEFGPRWGTQHKGIDLAAPTGTPIKCVADGVVTRVANDPKGYGNWVEVKHSDGTRTRYAHMSAFGNIKVGQSVGAGSVLGAVGSTGHSTGPHLHFEVRNANGVAVNPRTKMNF